MNHIKSAVIILNYNDAERTANLAKKLSQYKVLDTVVVVDNCSVDNSVQILQNVISEKIKLLCSPENGGYAKGNNLGVHYAIRELGADCIFVANPDIDVEERVMERIAQTISTEKQYGVISCLVRQGYNVWNLPSFWGIIESLFLIWFNLDKRNIKKKVAKSKNVLEEVGVVEGSFFCISKQAYEQIGGLDEGTFLYCEENILSRRLHAEKYKVGVLPGEYYDHLHSVSIKKQYGSKARAFHNFYNSFKYYNEKYLHVNKMQKIIFEMAYRIAYLERCIYDLIKR